LHYAPETKQENFIIESHSN